MNKKAFNNKNKSTKKYKTNYIDSKSRINNKPWLITVMAAMALTLIVVIVMALVSVPEGSEDMDNSATPDSAVVTIPTSDNVSAGQESTPTPTETQEETEATEVVTDENQPMELTALLDATGHSYQSLRDLGCAQLVTVDAHYTTSAQVMLWECTDDLWTAAEALTCQGYVGSMGSVDQMSETISGTPRGLYGIGEAFYRYNAPQTGLESFLITEDTYWVDDPNSYYYNQKVVGTENQDWNSAEPMAQYSAYNYGFVVEYNMYPTTPGAGSAIFFHIGYGPTEGCIAVSEDMVLAYLAALDQNLNPCILVN